MSTDSPRVQLDLSTMVARVILSLLVATTVVLLGLWLRASSALDFASTTIGVTISAYLAAKIRGERVGGSGAGPVTGRLQPIIDLIATLPVAQGMVRPGAKRFGRALGVGLTTAILESLLVRGPLAGLHMADLGRSVVAMILVILPLQAFLAWWRSRLEFSGSHFQRQVADALRQVIHPEGSDTVERPDLPLAARVGGYAVAHTAASVLARVIVQVAIPMVFSTPLSIAALAVAIITAIAGGPVWAALGRAVRIQPGEAPAQPAPTPTAPEEETR